MPKKPPKVLIVGAGFGGLWTARALAGAPVEVLLVDRRNYHTFLPLLYQVAAAELEPEGIAQPTRHILRHMDNIRFVKGEVAGIDPERRRVQTATSSLSYDYLVLAPGSVTHFYGIPGADRYAFELKDLEQGMCLRNHLLSCFEQAAHEPDPGRRTELLTFVIVGGGATGVEFVGALAELINHPLKKDFPEIDFADVHVDLLEAGSRLLKGLPRKLRDYTLKRLRAMGVDVRLLARVEKVSAKAIHLQDGTAIRTRTVVWTAGVRGAPLGEKIGLPTSNEGRIPVMSNLQVPGHPEIYVVGDLAYREENGAPLPMTAPVATQQGEIAATNILRHITGETPEHFTYSDRGTMVTIGRNSAVVRTGRWNFTGFPAWVLWLTVHFIKLIGFRNRLMVLVNWAWDYLLAERAIRLILPEKDRAGQEESSDGSLPENHRTRS